MLKPLLPMFRYDLSDRLRDIAEKTCPVKLKPIVVITKHSWWAAGSLWQRGGWDLSMLGGWDLGYLTGRK